MVDPGTILYRVGLERPLWVVADVNEEDIPRVHVDQKALLRTDAFAGQVLHGWVKQITPAGDPISKTFRVRIGLPNETALRVGMSVEANIISREKADVLLVPANAVIDSKVFAVVDGRAQLRKVDIGVRGAGSVEIATGISEGELVASPRLSISGTGPGSDLACRFGSSMSLIFTIAWTHVRHRARQICGHCRCHDWRCIFNHDGSYDGEGSQDDFIKTLVDALPHISMTDELRQPSRQPARRNYDVAEYHGLTPEVQRPAE